MNQSKPFWTKWRVVAVVLAMCSTGPAYLIYNNYQKVDWEISYWIREQARFAKYRSGTRLHHDLCVGNIKAGDTVDSVMQKYPTLHREEGGRWTILNTNEGYCFESTTIIAKVGQLKSACRWSCTFTDTFFDQKLSPDEQVELDFANKSIL